MSLSTLFYGHPKAYESLVGFYNKHEDVTRYTIIPNDIEPGSYNWVEGDECMAILYCDMFFSVQEFEDTAAKVAECFNHITEIEFWFTSAIRLASTRWVVELYVGESMNKTAIRHNNHVP